RVTEPRFVHAADAVARTEYDIDEVIAVKCLREPVGVGDLSLIPCVDQQIEDAAMVLGLAEDIEVLRVAGDAGVLPQRMRAPDHEGDTALRQMVQRSSIETLRPCGHAHSVSSRTPHSTPFAEGRNAAGRPGERALDFNACAAGSGIRGVMRKGPGHD